MFIRIWFFIEFRFENMKLLNLFLHNWFLSVSMLICWNSSRNQIRFCLNIRYNFWNYFYWRNISCSHYFIFDRFHRILSESFTLFFTSCALNRHYMRGRVFARWKCWRKLTKIKSLSYSSSILVGYDHV